MSQLFFIPFLEEKYLKTKRLKHDLLSEKSIQKPVIWAERLSNEAALMQVEIHFHVFILLFLNRI
jgi:hypothetical protein